MGTFNYDKLFILRHGHYTGLNRTLTEKGKKQIISATEQMLKLGINSPTIISSEARRASESVFAIEDEVHNRKLNNITTMYLFYFRGLEGKTSSETLEKVADFANQHKRASSLLIMTHLETANVLPEWLLKKDFNINLGKLEFKTGEGIYIDLTDGRYEEIRQT